MLEAEDFLVVVEVKVADTIGQVPREAVVFHVMVSARQVVVIVGEQDIAKAVILV